MYLCIYLSRSEEGEKLRGVIYSIYNFFVQQQKFKDFVHQHNSAVASEKADFGAMTAAGEAEERMELHSDETKDEYSPRQSANTSPHSWSKVIFFPNKNNLINTINFYFFLFKDNKFQFIILFRDLMSHS